MEFLGYTIIILEHWRIGLLIIKHWMLEISAASLMFSLLLSNFFEGRDKGVQRVSRLTRLCSGIDCSVLNLFKIQCILQCLGSGFFFIICRNYRFKMHLLLHLLGSVLHRYKLSLPWIPFVLLLYLFCSNHFSPLHLKKSTFTV